MDRTITSLALQTVVTVKYRSRQKKANFFQAIL